ncbi:3-hydroxyacyl-CoA dehydrogenase family protein [Burkholderia paludis]|uniref:3-hydroxyacyl-CoA dehydrogenase family protein n=1 Tax=Burkholderia paludis TaxID=1506587 RepID=UPI0007C7033B|nr:3-hydroxyacyl-CoA dehydrogenase family protein [Burkholderia paludis]
MEKIAIVGAGLMGQGIAQVFALAGHPVKVFDIDRAALASLVARTEHNLLELGLDSTASLNIAPAVELGEAVDDADIVFEAGPENLSWKQSLFEQLENLVPADTILASNTSAIPITRITERLRSGHRAMGTHWWNPPFLVPLVEVIRTPDTDPAIARRMFDLLKRAGKTPAMVEKDIPGFIGNRLQHALWREAIALVANGVCDAETVDTVVKASFGRRLPVLGPLENADLVGTDLTLAIHQVLLPEIECLPAPSPYLSALVSSGRLGMKTGHGFRRWSEQQQAELRSSVFRHLKAMDAADRREDN